MCTTNVTHIYTTGKEFIATELTLYIMQRKFHEWLLQGQKIGHQLLSVAEIYRQWHNGGMFCYELLTIAHSLCSIDCFLVLVTELGFKVDSNSEKIKAGVSYSWQPGSAEINWDANSSSNLAKSQEMTPNELTKRENSVKGFLLYHWIKIF